MADAPRGAWLAVGGAGVLAAALGASSDNGPVLCLFRRCTGGYCPACGLTRAAGRLARGDLAGSWHQHPFLLVAVIEAVMALATWWARKGPLAPAWALLLRHQNRLVVLNLAGLLALWALRLSLGDIPVPFVS